MVVDWDNFTPFTALGGGAMIGIASALLLLLNGHIAGISGIVGGLFYPQSGDVFWRVLFVAGLVAAPAVFPYAFLRPLPPMQIDAGWLLLVVAGLLVGLGTRFAAGCISGHGVCGLSRFSLRSLAATLVFMTTGFASVYAVRHLVGG